MNSAKPSGAEFKRRRFAAEVAAVQNTPKTNSYWPKQDLFSSDFNENMI